MSQAAQQPPAPGQQEGAAAPPVAPNRSARSSGCPPHVLAAIYGKQTVEQKKAALDTSLQRWWTGAWHCGA